MVSQPFPAIPPSTTIERRERVGIRIVSIPSTHCFLPFLITFAFVKEIGQACTVGFVWCQKEGYLENQPVSGVLYQALCSCE
jgi:hypothetical protein